MCSASQIYGGDFEKNFGPLRIYELYLFLTFNFEVLYFLKSGPIFVNSQNTAGIYLQTMYFELQKGELCLNILSMVTLLPV